MVKVSFVIPVYNCEKYVEKCVKSVMNQTYKDIEIILINDGSLDNSGVICEKLSEKDKRIRYIKRENKGCSYSRNEGIRIALGEYIIFVDSDDFIKESMCEEMLGKVIKTNSDVCICGFSYRYETNEKSVKKSIPGVYKTKYEFFLEASLFGHPVNKIYKRDILKRYNIYFNEITQVSEDLAFNVKYFDKINKISLVLKDLYVVNCRENSASTIFENYHQIFPTLEDIIKVTRSNEKYDEFILFLLKDIFCFRNYTALENLKLNKSNKYIEMFFLIKKKEKEYRKYFNRDIKMLINIRKIRLKFVFLKKKLTFLKRWMY